MGGAAKGKRGRDKKKAERISSKFRPPSLSLRLASLPCCGRYFGLQAELASEIVGRFETCVGAAPARSSCGNPLVQAHASAQLIRGQSGFSFDSAVQVLLPDSLPGGLAKTVGEIDVAGVFWACASWLVLLGRCYGSRFAYSRAGDSFHRCYQGRVAVACMARALARAHQHCGAH